MSNLQDFTAVFYALALAVLGNALLWAIASAFVCLFDRASRGLPPTDEQGPQGNAPDAAVPRGRRLAAGFAR